MEMSSQIYLKDEYIFFCDLNNQYGWAMSQNLPTCNFEWTNDFFIEDTEAIQDKILNLADDSSTGFIFEVDLKYSEDFHRLHNEFPLCPEQIEIKEELLSCLPFGSIIKS